MERVIQCNSPPVKGSGAYVLYWMTAYRRTHFNFARARRFLGDRARKPLLIFEPLACNYRWASVRFHQFVIDGMRENFIALESAPVTYRPLVEPALGEGKKEFSNLAADACLIVT